jgi:hypothetical protein
MLASTPVSTRDGVIRRVRTGYAAGATGAAALGVAVVDLDDDGLPFLVGFAEAEGAMEAEAGAVAVTETGGGCRVTGAGAGTTGRRTTVAGACVFEGRAGVTCWTGVCSAPGAVLAAGLAEGEAVMLTSTIAT